ncbi:MAG: hypothetical protein IJ383_04400 [Bacteroidales bacterium]|nr:hypothetical protein [Bacteroidales bacterium]
MKKKLVVLSIAVCAIMCVVSFSFNKAKAVSVNCVLHNPPGTGCAASPDTYCYFTIKESGEKCIFDNQDFTF